MQLPASRYRFVALGVVWSAYLVVFLSRLCIGPLAPYLKAAFDLSNAQIGGLTSATAVAYAPTLVFAGWLVDRIGVRRALLIGTIITGICIGAVALAPSYGTMLVLLGASGLGCGFIYPTAVKAIMLWFPPRERATAVGVNQAAVNVSGMLGAAIMPALALAFSWRAGFVFAACLAFAVCGVALALYRDPAAGETSPPSARGVEEPDAAVSAAGRAPDAAAVVTTDLTVVSEIEQGLPGVTGDEAADRAALTPGFGAVIRSRDILLLGLAALFLCVVEFAALAHLVLFLSTEWALSVAAAAGLLAFCQGAGGVSKPTSGLVSDRVLRRRRKPALMGLTVLACAACVVLALAHPGQSWLLWTSLLVLGVGALGWGGLFGALAGEIAGPPASGAAAGVTAAINNIGIIAGPPLFGLIVDHTGSYAPAWWTMAVSAAVALVLLLFVRERRRLA